MEDNMGFKKKSDWPLEFNLGEVVVSGLLVEESST